MKHVQIQIHGPLRSTSKIQSLDLWEARPRFQSIGPLGSTSKLQSIGPLGSMSKLKSMDLWEARPKFNLWTSGKHVQDSNPSDLWEARPKLQIHQTIGKHVLYSFSFSFFKKKKKKWLQAWTTFRPDPPTKRYVGNLPRDSVHILVQIFFGFFFFFFCLKVEQINFFFFFNLMVFLIFDWGLGEWVRNGWRG